MKTNSCANVGLFLYANRVPLCAVLGLIAIGGCAAGSATIVDPSTVQDVSVNPTSITVMAGGPAQSINANVDVTDNASPTVTWTSSDPSVARVTPSGLSAMVTGLRSGTVTITATSAVNAGKHGDASVWVMPGAVAQILVTAGAAQVAEFATLPLHAVALDAAGDTIQGTTFVWRASNAAVATVDSGGLVTGVAPGVVSITATAGSITSSTFALAVVNPPVSALAISAPVSSLAVSATTQAVAVAHDAAGHTLNGVTVAWVSSNPQVATVSSGGLITGVSSGTVNITATSGSATSNVLGLTVTASVVPPAKAPLASVTVTMSTHSMMVYQTLQAQAVAKDSSGNVLAGESFNWASSDLSVATVDNNGLVTGVGAGAVNITATVGLITSSGFALAVANPPVVTIAISAPASSLVVTATTQAVAVAHDAAGHTLNGATVVWMSSNPQVAPVSSDGLITGASAGTANITATSGSATSNVLAMTVTAPATPVVASITVSAPTSSVTVRGSLSANATALDSHGNTVSGTTFTWATSDASVATVSATGIVTGVAPGQASITAASGSVTSNAFQVTVVNPPVASVAVTLGTQNLVAYQTVQAQAVARDSSGYVLTGESVTWTSSDPTVATVDNNGLVTGVGPGTVNITATAGSVVSSAVGLTVVNPPVATITVTAPSSSMGSLSTMQAQAVAKDAAGNVLRGVTFTWASNNSGVATVSASGLISSNLIGTAVITASSGTVTSNAFTVTVGP